MNRVKSCNMIFVLLVFAVGCVTSKAGTYQLITNDVSLQSLSSETSLKLKDKIIPARRTRYVSLTPAVAEKMNILSGDNLLLNLFADTSYTAKISRVSRNVNHTITINGSIQSHPYSDLLICKTGNQVFMNIDIPDEGRRFIIRNDTDANNYLLMELDTSQLPFEDGPAITTGMEQNLYTQFFKSKPIENDPLEPVTIDIMIVYTRAAYEDAAFYFCGVDNYIAYLLNQANTTLNRSQVYVTLNLVHSAMVDYVENKIAYKYDPVLGSITSGSLYAALRHLGEKDSYMEEVRDWRDQYGADLVTLLVSRKALLNNSSIVGLANQLTNPSGNANDAFSVILTEYLNYTFIHEIGHNMGCGHSKYQVIYNYGGLFDYSYGWRWPGYCSVMSYPEDNHIRTNIFSNPKVINHNFPTGDSGEADNARTISQTKYAIAAYRPHVDINDVNIPEHIPAIIHVDINAPSGGNGLSWNTAYNTIRDALSEAESGDEIWIAEGIYKPTYGNTNKTDRSKTFILKKGVSIFGGFDGTETKRHQRNCIENRTILSGDIGTAGKNRDNSYRILLGADNSVIDGFTITKSYGDNTFYSKAGDGGGIYFEDANNITIANCIFDDNYSIKGSCIFVKDCNLVFIENCAFTNNSTKNKGTLYFYNSGVSIADSKFSGNVAEYSGGAIELSKCDANITNCSFVNNSAESGGAVDIWDSNAVILNCTFSKNSATSEGGAMETYSNTKVINSIIWDNKGSEIAGNPIVSYCDVKGGWYGMGSHNININPLFVDSIKGDYHLKSAAGRWKTGSQSWVKDDLTSPCIDAGDPNSDWSQELCPHGKRINVGAYGGTSEASMSLSDIGDCRDLNNDDLITWDDVLLLIEKWNSSDVPLKQDLNLDGIVDINDLAFYEDWSTDSNNTAPVFNSIEDKYTIAGSELSFSVSAIDSDSDELVYAALGLPDGAEFSEKIFSWIPKQAGTYQMIFIVSDYKSLDYITVQIIVNY